MESDSLVSQIAPLNTHESGPHPALIFLHGRGTDENDLLGLTPYLNPRLLVASVRAPYKFQYGGYTWCGLEENGTVGIDQLLNSKELFLRWLDDFLQNNPVDANRIFLFGFSMGAMMSLVLALSNPERFKGIVAHSGFLPQHGRLSYRWNDARACSFFIAHGKQDPIVPIELGRQAQQLLVQAHANVLYREYPIQHTISDESMSDIASWLLQQIE